MPETHSNIDFDDPPLHVQQLFNQNPNFKTDLEWLQTACGEVSSAQRVLVSLFDVVVTSLWSNSWVLIEQNQWNSAWNQIANCLRVICSEHPQNEDEVIQHIRNHGLNNYTHILAFKSGHPHEEAQLFRQIADESGDRIRTQTSQINNLATSSKDSIEVAAREAETSIAESLNSVNLEVEHVKNQLASTLADLEQRYGFVAEGVLGGAHEAAAAQEKEMARRHTRNAIRAKLMVAYWALFTQGALLALRFGNYGPTGIDGYLISIPIVGGPVGVLIYIASSETRNARRHLHNHARWQGLNLQLKSFRPYLQDLIATASELDEKGLTVQDQVVKELTPKMFVGDIGPYSSDGDQTP